MKRCQKKKLNMNAKMLLLGAVIATFTAATFASDAQLTPRAKGNQIKVATAAPETDAITMAYVESAKPFSPRVQAAQIKVIQGILSDRNPALECQRTMQGTPRAVTACSQSVTMPGCAKPASSKLVADASR